MRDNKINSSGSGEVKTDPGILPLHPADFGGMKSNGDRSVASSFGLRSGLRQSGGRCAAAFYGTPEGVPSGSGLATD
jgi:hypothetical protein